MKYPLYLTTALLLTAMLATAGCGNSQDPAPGASSSSEEVEGLLKLPDGEATRQTGIELMQDAQMGIAGAKGSMSVYTGMINEKGSPARQQQAAGLQKQYAADIKKAQALSFEMADKQGQALRDLVKQYNDNWRELKQLVDQAETLMEKALSDDATSMAQPVRGAPAAKTPA